MERSGIEPVLFRSSYQHATIEPFLPLPTTLRRSDHLLTNPKSSHCLCSEWYVIHLAIWGFGSFGEGVSINFGHIFYAFITGRDSFWGIEPRKPLRTPTH